MCYPPVRNCKLLKNKITIKLMINQAIFDQFNGYLKLLSPDFFCDFLYKFKLCPLLFLCQFVTDLTGSKSALRA